MPVHSEPGRSLPRLRGPRLTLRPLVPADAPAVFPIWGDPVVMRWVGGDPFPSEQAVRDTLEKVAAEGTSTGRHRFGMELNEADEGSPPLVGTCGLFPNKAVAPVHEIAYHLNPRCVGKGYATEAARLLTDYAFDVLGLPEVVGLVFPPNERSLRVLERVGYHCEGLHGGYHEDELVVFRMERAAWDRLR